MSWVAVGTSVMGAMGGKKQRKAASRESARARAERAEQNRLLEKQKDEYRAMKFTNPYADMENPYAENVYEDLTVNQQQAQFQAQQGAQQRANILGSLRGAAGTSGIAGLAQSLASQGQLQTQQAAASIGEQEAMNQRLAARGAQQVQAGAAAVDLQQRKGEEMVQTAESGRQATLLGMTQAQTAGANQAAMQAAMNEQRARASSDRMMTSALTGLAGADWSSLGGGGNEFTPIQPLSPSLIPTGTSGPDLTPRYPTPLLPVETGGPIQPSMTYEEMKRRSDRRLKKNINLIGNSPSGLNIYSFEYKNPQYGKGLFQGVMSDEIPQKAVKTRDGYDVVDYSKLDVEFKQI